MEEIAKATIFIFSTAYHPFIGGAEVAIEEITKRLSASFRFFIFTARLRRDLPKREVRGDVVIIRIGFGTRFDKFLLPFLGALSVLRVSRREQPNMYWAVMASWGSGAAYLANIIRFRNCVPVVLTLQEGDSEAHIRRSRLGLIGFSWRRALLRTNYLTAISNYLRDAAFRYGYSGPARVVPNGVDCTQFSNDFSRNDLTKLRVRLGFGVRDLIVITTSRLSPKNGVDTLIRAVAELAGNYRERSIRLLVVGDGEERPALEALARELGVGENVVFAGAVVPREIPSYLFVADIFARPSRSEGLGNSFLEAMAAGLPIIGTLVGGIPDFLEDGVNGLACRPDDPIDLAEKIMRLAGDAELRSRISEAGKKTVQGGFRWDSIAPVYQKIFEQAMFPKNPAILIATPLYPPAVGGPASFARDLALSLSRAGCRVSVLTYGRVTNDAEEISNEFSVTRVSSRIPSGPKHLVYVAKALRLLKRVDAAIVLDPFIVGVPVALAARLLKKPFIIRVDGDFVWESYVERTGHELTLEEFCRRLPRGLPLSPKERLALVGSGYTFRSARQLVFSSEWRERIFDIAFPDCRGGHVFLRPSWPNREPAARTRDPVVLFAGRFIRIKNTIRLARSFLAVAPLPWRLELVGEGPQAPALRKFLIDAKAGDRVRIAAPMPRYQLDECMRRAAVFALPSLSDVAPRVILDCVRLGTPFLMTRETGLWETLKDVGLFVNPLDEADIQQNLRRLMDPGVSKEYQKRLAAFTQVRAWEEIANEWIQLVRMSRDAG